MKKILKIIGRVLLIVILLFVALIGRGVFATSLEESVLVTGTQNLVDSIISWLTRYRNNNMWRIFHILCLLPKNK